MIIMQIIISVILKKSPKTTKRPWEKTDATASMSDTTLVISWPVGVLSKYESLKESIFSKTSFLILLMIFWDNALDWYTNKKCRIDSINNKKNIMIIILSNPIVSLFNIKLSKAYWIKIGLTVDNKPKKIEINIVPIKRYLYGEAYVKSLINNL